MLLLRGTIGMQQRTLIESPIQLTSTRRQALRQSASAPSEEEIRHRAYEIFLEGGAVPGRELEDWLRAERELKKIAEYNRSRRRVLAVSES
jgi:hypothetical protein